jgi:polysaccharide export outer membrane protein
MAMKILLIFASLALTLVTSAQEAGGRINAWDEVEIRVFQEDDLTTRGQVGADGSLTVPLIGAVRLAGMTAIEASNHIAAKLRDGYLVNPQVTVTVAARVRRTISIFGQVERAGVYELPHHRQLTLVEAIGLAGGLTRIADPKKITLKRSNGATTRHDFRALTMGKAGSDVIIREGDVITVEESLF